jgi:carbonic anhydrase
VAQSTVVQDAWERGQDLTLHGWIYGLRDGLLQDLRMTVDSQAALDDVYSQAVARVAAQTR